LIWFFAQEKPPFCAQAGLKFYSAEIINRLHASSPLIAGQ
jgi:hypothetical protein